MTLMPLELFVEKVQPKVGLAGYSRLFAYFVVEAKIKRIKTYIKLKLSFSIIFDELFSISVQPKTIHNSAGLLKTPIG